MESLSEIIYEQEVGIPSEIELNDEDRSDLKAYMDAHFVEQGIHVDIKINLSTVKLGIIKTALIIDILMFVHDTINALQDN